MTAKELLRILAEAPLIASVQASPGSPTDHPATLLKLAEASCKNGVSVVRLEGAENIRSIRPALHLPVIGLIKRQYTGSEVYITPTQAEVASLLELGCEVIALDGTLRARPGGESFADLVRQIHQGGALAMADCDDLVSAEEAALLGADLIGTTLSGYTEASRPDGPDLELVRLLIRSLSIPVIAEGRYSHRWQVEAALRAGASAVTIGGALNDPVKQTLALQPRFHPSPAGTKTEAVGAVDIGGTWLRFGVFQADWSLQSLEKVPNPHDRTATLDWIRSQVQAHPVRRVGVSTAGIVDPATGEVWRAKEYLMPNYVGITFSEASLGVPTIAWGDGHATAWAHACLPQYAGRAVATLALGTGVGCGFVRQGEIWRGPRGEYPRVNDLPSAQGETYEALLGGIHLTRTPTDEQKAKAIVALDGAINTLRTLYFPDDIVIGGGVGLSDWLAPRLVEHGVCPSPLGPDAGLFGAAALALFS